MLNKYNVIFEISTVRVYMKMIKYIGNVIRLLSFFTMFLLQKTYPEGILWLPVRSASL